MMTRRSSWMLAAVVIALVATSLPRDAAARAKKNSKVLKVVVNGKRVKLPPKYVQLGAGGGTIAFSATGTKVAHGLRGISKSVSVTCVNDLSLQTFPFTTTDCLTIYSEVRARPLSQKMWLHNLQDRVTQVTIDSYDGTRIAGRFHSVVPPASTNPDLPPVTIDGEFRGPVVRGDPSR